MADTTDPVADRLTEIRERWAKIETVEVRTEVVPEQRGTTRADPAEWCGDISGLVAALEAVLGLHREHRIYEVCGHEHTADEVTAGTAVDAGEFVTCQDGYAYSVCRECCTRAGRQTEECASSHWTLSACWPCLTYQAISAALLGEESDGG